MLLLQEFVGFEDKNSKEIYISLYSMITEI